MKTFNVPLVYRSPLITAVKSRRRLDDKMKKDLSPTLLDFGPVQFYVARHFGFCYGVENAIDIAFSTVRENPGRRIFLLSEMIHNPMVNEDLQQAGIRFLQDTGGRQLISFDELTAEDIVITPAFGTTLAIESILKERGISIAQYNTTCPFVEKVWNRAGQIAEKGYTVVVHGKPTHEETRATFSHAAAGTPTIVINDMDEAKELAEYIKGEKNPDEFYSRFNGRYSDGFDAIKDLKRIGVVNQTTMLASDTQAIADFLRHVMIDHYSLDANAVAEHFADTRDTLCYATNDNQSAVSAMLKTQADLAIVVGGYNSSNTSHLVELCEEVLPTFFIKGETEILSPELIRHHDLHKKEEILSAGFLPANRPAKILLSSGASCPDAVVEAVIQKIAGFFPDSMPISAIINMFQ